AFYACINNDIAPTMAAMRDLNNDMQTGCMEGGVAMVVSLAGFLAATLTAIGIIEAATAAAAATLGVGSPAASATATITLAAWVGFVVELLIDVGSVFGGLSVGATQIGQGYDSLKAFLGGKDSQLDVGSLKLRPAELAKIQDWENDWIDPGAK